MLQAETHIININSKKAWVICFTSALFFMYAFMQMNLLNSINTQLTKNLGFSTFTLGIFSSTYLYALSLFFIPIGLLLDRYSTRSLILIGMTIELVGVFLFASASNISVAVIGRGLAGAIHGLAFLSSLRLASRWLPRYIGLAMGLTITIGIMGGIIVQIPLTVMISLIGWRQSMWIILLIGILIWLLLWLVVTEPPRDQHCQIVSSFWKTFLQVTTNKQNWICALYTGLLNSPIIILGALWGNIFLTHGMSFTNLQAGEIISMIYLGTILGTPIIGWFSDHFTTRKFPMILGALSSIIIFTPLVFIHTSSIILLMSLFFLIGFSTSTQSLSYPVIVESNPIHDSSIALGFSCVIIMGIGAVLQPIFGLLIQLNSQGLLAFAAIDNYRLAFILIPFTFLGCLLLAFTIIEPKVKKNH